MSIMVMKKLLHPAHVNVMLRLPLTKTFHQHPTEVPENVKVMMRMSEETSHCHGCAESTPPHPLQNPSWAHVQVEYIYISGQQVCSVCGYDQLPIDESGKVKFQPNRKTQLLERRMKKLQDFGIHGTVNQSVLATLTDRQAAELRSEVGERGLTSVEASVLKEAKDKLRRAKSLGYEFVEDRYSSAHFCGRVHEEGKGLADCIQADLLA
eukprot:s977_g6.t1